MKICLENSNDENLAICHLLDLPTTFHKKMLERNGFSATGLLEQVFSAIL